TQNSGVESATAKIERVLPLELRQQVWALQDTLVFNLDTRDSPPPSNVIVTAVTLAAHERKSLAIDYESYSHEITQRVIDPYGIAVHTGSWCVSSYCHLRQDLRTFRLDRIHDAHQTDEPFERPKDFDV